jgi:hypothetical protein
MKSFSGIPRPSYSQDCTSLVPIPPTELQCMEQSTSANTGTTSREERRSMVVKNLCMVHKHVGYIPPPPSAQTWCCVFRGHSRFFGTID